MARGIGYRVPEPEVDGYFDMVIGIILDDDAVEAMASLMARRAAVLTPNAPEAERLTGVGVADLDGQRRAAER